MDIDDLIARADAYKAAAGIVDDSTVSYRVFGDTKKLGALRRGADITTRRFLAALRWFDQNWPTSEPAKPPEDAA
ncbi:hypothetical protein [Paracoccus sp. SSJ]|uniref:hypothetical protein n=1 Tax=Paracoccus sp. SSJ TaxID=3050636 RepID=UPI000930E3D2|nr:hypothetical protein [Paracoccus sp. SSJ]MDK8871513.1 hypothetical protein [Paracoccus sp. SSJ]